ncbi:hypothetical protein [Devosia sp. CN2-171]|uniref:hypothetical protein n=1 Tax=Devosia sp. CN2-171 TaxID=3400909 RepID=UPI003BF9021E
MLLAAMLEDVRLAHRRFKATLDGQPAHDLTDDLNKSFARLSQQLGETIATLENKVRA